MRDTKKQKNIRISEKQAEKALQASIVKVQTIFKNEIKMEKLFAELGKKFKLIKDPNEILAMIPEMASLLHSYWKKEYDKIPFNSILSIAGALFYFISPLDIIPDTIPGVGHVDDAAVIQFCLNMVSNDLENYKEWKKKHNSDVSAN